jgi:hypothetical protein
LLFAICWYSGFLWAHIGFLALLLIVYYCYRKRDLAFVCCLCFDIVPSMHSRSIAQTLPLEFAWLVSEQS